MKAAITGASGLVGSNLAIELLKQGHEVRCTRRKSSKVDHLSAFPIEWVEGDLSDEDALTRAFTGCEGVFHCAAEISFRRRPTPQVWDTNVEGTSRVLRAVLRAGSRRLVHCSSVVATAISENGQPVTEDLPWNFDRFGLDEGYSITKLEGQKRVLEAAAGDVDAVVVNPCYMLGPYDSKPSSGRLLLNLLSRRVPGTTAGYNNFVDVRDVCRGMILAYEKGRRGEKYILGGENLLYRDAMHLIATVCGVAPPRFDLPASLVKLYGWAGDVSQWVTGKEALVNSVTARYAYCQGYIFSSEKAQRELGYQWGPLDKTIADALAWFRSQGMAP